MKKLSSLIVIILSAQWLNAQTYIVHLRNGTGCDVICGMEFRDDLGGACGERVLNTQITVPAGTQVDLDNLTLNGFGYSSTPGDLQWGIVVPFPEVTTFYCRTVANCPPGNVTGLCTLNPFGSNYQLTPSCGCATSPIYIQGFISPLDGTSWLAIEY